MSQDAPKGVRADHPARPDAGLLLLAHGSSKSEGSSQPTRDLADALRRRQIFGEVETAFWKEGLRPREILASLRSPRIYIVPNLISEGYFTRTVFPRELGIHGAITEEDGRTLFYCRPVGSHPSMTPLICRRALTALQRGTGAPATSLIIVGHGTARDPNSARAIHGQVDAVRKLGIFGEVHAAFLEQEPLVSRWREIAPRQDVAVVPFFISNGPHCLEDIPKQLGLRHDPPLDQSLSVSGPHQIGERRLWYTGAIGTEPHLADVVLDLIDDFSAALGAPG